MFMCHFSSEDPTRPSFFEMVAQQELVAFFGPAIKYAVNLVALRGSTVAATVSDHFDELFALGRFFVERHYLNHYDASFAENFYGLKRVKVATGGPSTHPQARLTRTDRNLSLILLVAVPYLKGRLDELYKRTSGHSTRSWLADLTASPSAQSADVNSTESPQQPRWKMLMGVVRWCFIFGYPIFHALYQGLFFLYQLMYLYDHTSFYTPFLHLQRLEVKRLTLEDQILQGQTLLAERANRWKSMLLAAHFNSMARLLLKSWYLLMDYSALILPIGLFLFKFLEWWYAENRQTPPAMPTPPPPAPPKVVVTTAVAKSRRQCGLCGKERTNPAMVPASGHVFCYPCLFAYVTAHGCCPATLMPCSLDHIRKIYEST